MSLEELTHECMAHAPIQKLALMSSQVDCLPCTLHFPKLLRVPCSLCDEAKAKRQPYPDTSTTEIDNEDDLMTWDLINLGEKWTMIGCNRYILLFIIKKSRYAITILLKDHTNFKGILKRTIAKAGFTPKTVLCYRAGEYVCTEIQAFF
eukprot:1606262-Rhodomonas_salina.3